MSQKTDAALTTQAQIIRDETTALANTKSRVYTNLKDAIDSKINNDRIIDEDNMASDSAVHIPTQQSVKQFVEDSIEEAALGIVTSWKNPVRVATTVNGTLATDFENGDTIDGVVLASGDRILLKNQTDQTANGIYIVAASGAPSRSSDANTGTEIEGAGVTVLLGTTNANSTWLQTTDSITLGVSNIVWTQLGTNVPPADGATPGIAKLYTSTGSSTDGSMDRNSITNALALKENFPVRADVTLANGVVTVDWSAGDIQNLTISETKVITTISNPLVGKTIILIIPGTNSMTFSGLTSITEGTYQASVENRIYIQCLKVSGGAEYRITYDHNTSPFPFSALTDGATVTWTVAALEAISNRTLTIAGARTFAISGALNGYSGNCKITASGTSRTITIPSGSTHRMKGVGDTAVKTVSIPDGETYIFTWLYDGTNYDWWYID